MYDNKFGNPNFEVYNIEKSAVNNSYVNSYKKIISKTADLLKDTKMDNPFNASLVFEYLLWNGYFSKNKDFKYSMDNRCLAANALGADIMRGYSVCLNNSDMLAKLLKELDIPAKILNCYDKPSNTKLPNDYRFPLKAKIATSKVNTKNLNIKDKIKINLVGNHTVTVFKYKNLDYVIDPTNCVFLKPHGYKKLRYFGTNNIVKIKKKSSYIANHFAAESDNFLEEYDQIIRNLFLQKKGNNKINKEFILTLYDIVLNFCTNNTGLFEEFHTDITPQIDTVCKTLRR